MLVLSVPNPLVGQVWLEPAVAVGPTIPLGDLGTMASMGLGANVFVMVRNPNARYAFGLEGSFHHFQLDSVVQFGFDTTPSRIIDGPISNAVGAMIRYEYNIIDQRFYAVGGVGMYFRWITPDREATVNATITSRDVAAQAGLGYRGPGRLSFEIRVINLFTVHESEVLVPVTVGLRF